MDTPFGSEKAGAKNSQELQHQQNYEATDINVPQSSSFLLDQLVEFEDADNLIEEMLRNEEMDETFQNEMEISKFIPEVREPPLVSFTSPKKKVIVQYIENPECALENLSSMNKDFLEEQKDSCVVSETCVENVTSDLSLRTCDIMTKEQMNGNAKASNQIDVEISNPNFMPTIVEENPSPAANPLFNQDEILESTKVTKCFPKILARDFSQVLKDNDPHCQSIDEVGISRIGIHDKEGTAAPVEEPQALSKSINKRKTTDDMFSSEEEDDHIEIQNIQHAVMKSSLFDVIPPLDEGLQNKFGLRQCVVSLERVKHDIIYLNLLSGKSRSTSGSSSRSSSIKFVSRTPSNSSRSRSASVVRNRKRLLSSRSNSGKSRSPSPKARKLSTKILVSDSEDEKPAKRSKNEPSTATALEEIKMSPIIDETTSLPNKIEKKQSDPKKDDDTVKTKKKKDKIREREKSHEKQRLHQKHELEEKKYFKKEILEKNPQLKKFLEALLIEIGCGTLDFLKPFTTKNSLVDLAKFEETVLKAVKIIERSGQYFGGGVASTPKVPTEPKDHIRALGSRSCKVSIKDLNDMPDQRQILEGARRRQHSYSNRRRDILTEGLKTLKKVISPQSHELFSRKHQEDKVERVEKSFKIPKKTDLSSTNELKKSDTERKPHRSDTYNFNYKKQQQNVQNKKSFEEDLKTGGSFMIGNLIQGMQRTFKVDRLQKQVSRPKENVDREVEKILEKKVLDRRGCEINAFTTWFEDDKNFYKCWICSLSLDSKTLFLKHVDSERHISNTKTFSNPPKEKRDQQEPKESNSYSAIEGSFYRRKSTQPFVQSGLSSQNKRSTTINTSWKSPSPEPFASFENDVDGYDEDSDENLETEPLVPFYLGLLLPLPKPLENPKPLEPPNLEIEVPVSFDSPNNSERVLSPALKSSPSQRTESISPVSKLSAKDLKYLPPPMSSLDRVENYRKEQSPPPGISSSPYSPGGCDTPPSHSGSIIGDPGEEKESFSSGPMTLSDSGFKINTSDSFLGVIKPKQNKEKDVSTNLVKPSIRVKNQNELNLPAPEKEKKSDVSVVETLLTAFRVSLERGTIEPSDLSQVSQSGKKENSAHISRAKEKLSELTSQGYENITKEDALSFINRYRQVPDPLPGAPPLPTKDEKLSSTLAKIRAKKAAQSGVMQPNQLPSQFASDHAISPQPFQMRSSPKLSNDIPMKPFPVPPPSNARNFGLAQNNNSSSILDNSKRHKLFGPPTNGETQLPKFSGGPDTPYSDTRLPGSNFSSLPPTEQHLSKHSQSATHLPKTFMPEDYDNEFGQENGDELNHSYIMEIYRDWKFVHDIGGWAGIILDYSKRCEEANGGPDSLGSIFQNSKYNDQIKNQNGQVNPAYSYHSSTQNFTCNICDLNVSGKANFDNHLMGKKHVAKEEELKGLIISRQGYIPPKPLILPLLSKFDKSPLIGLEYLVEILQPPQHPTYRCIMCDSVLESTNIVPHLVDVKHRMAYLKLYFPSIFERFNEFPDTSFWRRSTFTALNNVIAAIENQFGRLPPRLENSIDDFEARKNSILQDIQSQHQFRHKTDLDLSFLRDPFDGHRPISKPGFYGK